MKGQENLRTKLLIVCVYKQNLHLCCSLDMESSNPDTAEKTAQWQKTTQQKWVSY